MPCQGETALPALCKGAGARIPLSVHWSNPHADPSAVVEIPMALTVALPALGEGMPSMDAGAVTRPRNPQ